MLDEWLFAAMPRDAQRSKASLLLRPSSLASSYTRILFTNALLARRPARFCQPNLSLRPPIHSPTSRPLQRPPRYRARLHFSRAGETPSGEARRTGLPPGANLVRLRLAHSSSTPPAQQAKRAEPQPIRLHARDRPLGEQLSVVVSAPPNLPTFQHPLLGSRRSHTDRAQQHAQSIYRHAGHRRAQGHRESSPALRCLQARERACAQPRASSRHHAAGCKLSVGKPHHPHKLAGRARSPASDTHA